jgi:plastocyanin
VSGLRLTTILLGFAAMALSACSAGGESPSCENPQRATEVTMDDFSYEPTCVEASVGTPLDVVNEGQAPHTFTIESDPGVDLDVPAGERASLDVPELDPGSYSVICTYHPQMEAALLVSS